MMVNRLRIDSRYLRIFGEDRGRRLRRRSVAPVRVHGHPEEEHEYHPCRHRKWGDDGEGGDHSAPDGYTETPACRRHGDEKQGDTSGGHAEERKTVGRVVSAAEVNGATGQDAGDHDKRGVEQRRERHEKNSDHTGSVIDRDPQLESYG